MCNKRNDSAQEHVPAVLSRREVLKASAAAAIMDYEPYCSGFVSRKGWVGGAFCVVLMMNSYLKEPRIVKM